MAVLVRAGHVQSLELFGPGPDTRDAASAKFAQVLPERYPGRPVRTPIDACLGEPGPRTTSLPAFVAVDPSSKSRAVVLDGLSAGATPGGPDCFHALRDVSTTHFMRHDCSGDRCAPGGCPLPVGATGAEANITVTSRPL
jgi:hypothetical protein